MIGAIAGDIIGSTWEYPFFKGRIAVNDKPYKDFDLFQAKSRYTDDTTMSMAIADAILNQASYKQKLHDYGHHYWGVGYGGRFKDWLKRPLEEALPYDSFGNGSGMRVSAVAWAFDTESVVLEEAKKTALPTHNHPEGIKGAQAMALAVFMARNGATKAAIKAAVESKFGYNLNRTCAEIRPTYIFDVTCQGSVPESIICFLEAEDFEDAIRLAISLGGDTDTMASMAGAIAQAYFKKIPKVIYERVLGYLDEDLKKLLFDFEKCYVVDYELV